MGDYRKALEYNELELKIRKKVLGDEHIDIANSYNNLGLESKVSINESKKEKVEENETNRYKECIATGAEDNDKQEENFMINERKIKGYETEDRKMTISTTKDIEEDDIDYIQAKKKKGDWYVTDILDCYNDAKILTCPLYICNNVKVYKVVCKSQQYVFKIHLIEDDLQDKILQEEYEMAKSLGNEHPHFSKCIDIQKKKISSCATQMEIYLNTEGIPYLSL